jgi:hypothetical protein
MKKHFFQSGLLCHRPRLSRSPPNLNYSSPSIIQTNEVLLYQVTLILSGTDLVEHLEQLNTTNILIHLKFLKCSSRSKKYVFSEEYSELSITHCNEGAKQNG